MRELEEAGRLITLMLVWSQREVWGGSSSVFSCSLGKSQWGDGADQPTKLKVRGILHHVSTSLNGWNAEGGVAGSCRVKIGACPLGALINYGLGGWKSGGSTWQFRGGRRWFLAYGEQKNSQGYVFHKREIFILRLSKYLLNTNYSLMPWRAVWD